MSPPRSCRRQGMSDSSTRYNACSRLLSASSHAAPGTGQRQRESYLGCLFPQAGSSGNTLLRNPLGTNRKRLLGIFLKGAIVLNNSPGSRKYSSICTDLIFMYLCICIYLLGCVGSQLCMQDLRCVSSMGRTASPVVARSLSSCGSRA